MLSRNFMIKITKICIFIEKKYNKNIESTIDIALYFLQRNITFHHILHFLEKKNEIKDLKNFLNYFN